jgi:hypothetical protein
MLLRTGRRCAGSCGPSPAVGQDTQAKVKALGGALKGLFSR